MQKERPILFSTDMVKAILEVRKTMTRRVMKPQPTFIHDMWFYSKRKVSYALPEYPSVYNCLLGIWDACPYGKVGDILWVKETFFQSMNMGYVYKATHNTEKPLYYNPDFVKWKPSRFMPKEAARIWLEVLDVKVERLQNISEEDAIKEGVKRVHHTEPRYENYQFNFVDCLYAKTSFQSLWQKINGEASFNLNPFVWVISFEVLSKTGETKY